MPVRPAAETEFIIEAQRALDRCRGLAQLSDSEVIGIRVSSALAISQSRELMAVVDALLKRPA